MPETFGELESFGGGRGGGKLSRVLSLGNILLSINVSEYYPYVTFAILTSMMEIYLGPFQFHL